MQRFVSSIGNIEKAVWVFNCLGRPAVLKKHWGPIMSNFWGQFFHVFRVKKTFWIYFENIFAFALKSCIAYRWEKTEKTSSKGISTNKCESDILRYIVCKWFFGNFLEFFGNSLGIFWEFFGNFLGIFWKFFGNFLGIFGNSLGILWEFFANGKSWQKLDDSRNLMEFFNDFEA